MRGHYASLSVCLLGAVVLALPAAIAQTFLVDQQNDPQPTTQKDNVPAVLPGQTFIPTLPGIDFADFILNNFSGVDGQLSVTLRSGIGGSILGTSDVVTIPGNNTHSYYRFLFPSRITLTLGVTYALEVVQVGGGTSWIENRPENNYPFGIGYWINGPAPWNFDYNFREGIMVIPEPNYIVPMTAFFVWLLWHGGLASNRREISCG